MLTRLAAAGLALLVTLVLLAGAAGAGITAISTGSGSAVSAGVPVVSPTAVSSIPADYLMLYQSAAATCPGLAWLLVVAAFAAQAVIGIVQTLLGVPEVLVSLHVTGAVVLTAAVAYLWTTTRSRGPLPGPSGSDNHVEPRRGPTIIHVSRPLS